MRQSHDTSNWHTPHWPLPAVGKPFGWLLGGATAAAEKVGVLPGRAIVLLLGGRMLVRGGPQCNAAIRHACMGGGSRLCAPVWPTHPPPLPACLAA
jgi:hypothetical protein